MGVLNPTNRRPNPFAQHRFKNHVGPTSWEDAIKLIPNGTQTLSKCPNRFVNGVYPKFLVSGDGCYVTDQENHSYIDFICGLGPILLGYKQPLVDWAVRETIHRGATILSLPHPDEFRLAKLLNDHLSWAEKIKFYKTGSDALSAAVKVSRAYTCKDKVLVCGYHGWHDWYTIVNDKKAGIVSSLATTVAKFTYNDLESLRQLFKEDIAAVVLEPIVYEEPKDNFLQEVIKLAHEHMALVIFDEVVTGFRFGITGAAGYFNVSPDLACYSKAMGNGYSIAALTGKAEYMNVFERDDFFISGTFGGDLIGINAARAVIELLADKDRDYIGKIWEAGETLKDGFTRLTEALNMPDVKIIGYPPRTMFIFPTIAHKALFWQECLREGVMFGYANFVTSQHSIPTIQNTISACELALRMVKDNWNEPIKSLYGDMPIEVFRLVKSNGQ